MSDSFVAAAPVSGAEPAPRAPTDWKTDVMQTRIRKRYAAERRFRLLGLGAVSLSVAFLAFLLITMMGNGLRGFTQTEIALPIDFRTAGLQIGAGALEGPGVDAA